MHGIALALILLPLTGAAGNAFVVTGMALVAVSFLVARRVQRPAPEQARASIRIPADFAAAYGREREASASAA